MASIFKRPSGTWTVEIYLDKDRKTKIGLATKSQREAQRTADRIQALADSKKTGIENQDCVTWLVKVREESSKLYEKLVALNLAEEIKEERIITLDYLEKSFLAQKVVSEETIKQNTVAFLNLKTFFGKSYSISKITAESAEQFMLWYRSEDANSGKVPGVLAENTISRRLVSIRSFFAFALRLGWVKSNPFVGIKAKSTPAFKRWYYISIPLFMQFLESVESPKWRVILCLGRFAGCRGPSELYNLTWSMIKLDAEPTVTLRATKKEGLEDELRTIPICPILENELKKYREVCDTEKLFPKITKHSNIYYSVTKMLKKTEIELFPEPWYNNRRSFCSDIMESGIDPKLYEAVCGHRFETGMKHYQILHPDRQRAGFDKIRKLFTEEKSGDKSGDKMQ